jgi:hypothetical protein
MSKHLLLALHDLTQQDVQDELIGFLEDAFGDVILNAIKCFYARKPRGSSEKLFGVQWQEITVDRVVQNINLIRLREPLLLSGVVFSLLLHYEQDLLAVRQLGSVDHLRSSWVVRLTRVAALLPDSFFADVVPKPVIEPRDAWATLEPLLARLEPRFFEPDVLDFFKSSDLNPLFALMRYALACGFARAAIEARAQWREAQETLLEREAMVAELRLKLKKKDDARAVASQNKISLDAPELQGSPRALQQRIDQLSAQILESEQQYQLELRQKTLELDHAKAFASGNVERIKSLEGKLEQGKQANQRQLEQIKSLESQLSESFKRYGSLQQALQDTRNAFKPKQTKSEKTTNIIGKSATLDIPNLTPGNLEQRLASLEQRFEAHLRQEQQPEISEFAGQAKPALVEFESVQAGFDTPIEAFTPTPETQTTPRLLTFEIQEFERIADEALEKAALLRSGEWLNNTHLFTFGQTLEFQS